nr:hypothetical protein [Tanacetum cinerariifolium]
NWVLGLLDRSWGMVWSGESGGKIEKLGFTEFGGKHCAVHSVSKRDRGQG